MCGGGGRGVAVIVYMCSCTTSEGNRCCMHGIMLPLYLENILRLCTRFMPSEAKLDYFNRLRINGSLPAVDLPGMHAKV